VTDQPQRLAPRRRTGEHNFYPGSHNGSFSLANPIPIPQSRRQTASARSLVHPHQIIGTPTLGPAPHIPRPVFWPWNLQTQSFSPDQKSFQVRSRYPDSNEEREDGFRTPQRKTVPPSLPSPLPPSSPTHHQANHPPASAAPSSSHTPNPQAPKQKQQTLPPPPYCKPD
jgi:hypothetical protein